MTTPNNRESRRGRSTARGRGGRRDRHISVRAVRRDPPDLRKLSRAIVAIAIAQAEAEAQAQVDIAEATPVKPEEPEVDHD
jgi:hypothetical protein